MDSTREFLVVCSDKITIWDIEKGEHLLNIRSSCPSPPNGVLCLKNQYLVSSQTNKPGSVAAGAICFWELNKPQAILSSYPIETINPLASTNDGLYLAGGAPSGNIYLWEVASGKLLKLWAAHQHSVSCMAFSNDDSFLISGADDGMICSWSMVSVLDAEDIGTTPTLFHCLMQQNSKLTGLITTSCLTSPKIVTSSLDGSCKVWELLSGSLIGNYTHDVAITAIVLHPAQQFLFLGTADGRILIKMLNIELLGDPGTANNQPDTLLKHNGPITALQFCTMGLLSACASEDSTICLWDVFKGIITRRFDNRKGLITNLLVISGAPLPRSTCNWRARNRPRASLLDKHPQQGNSFNETTTLLSCCEGRWDRETRIYFRSTNNLKWQIQNLEQEQATAAVDLKAETRIAKRKLATNMAEHIMDMNMQLQSFLLNLKKSRLLQPSKVKNSVARNDSQSTDGKEHK